MFNRVAPESEKYKLTVGRYTSDSHAGDALKWHNGMQFSTIDRDNDVLLGKRYLQPNNKCLGKIELHKLF